ncbi:MAG: AhpC/TSA family protein [Deltaproteobacteria bacterium]|nr:AhpC/TSA family protein [Deltaproteobacteria bacterium]
MAKRLVKESAAPDFEFMTPWEGPLTLRSLLEQGPVVLYFLRYLGCPLCRMKLDEIKRDAEKFTQKGYQVLAVIQSTRQTVAETVTPEEYPFTIACDPDAEAYISYRVTPGSFLQYVAPHAALKAMKALREGYTHGKKEGLELQVPAVFVIGSDGTLHYVYYGKNVADVPENEEILEALA